MSIRLHLLFSVGFVLLLVIAAAGGMLHVTIAQTDAAAQIAVASRQQTLAQQVGKQALVFARSKSALEGKQLEAALAAFERGNKALLEGGNAPAGIDGTGDQKVPALDDANAIALGHKMTEVSTTLRAAVTKLLKADPIDNVLVDDVVHLSGDLLASSSALTERLFATSRNTLGRLELVEGAVITLGLLAGIVALEIGRRISTAVVRLTEKSEAISQGQVDLPIDVPGPAEIGSLGKSLDRMRISLKKSMEMLQKKTA